MLNTDLQKAKIAKNDEFYTQFSDIEAELKHYEYHLVGKVIFCNCDDPSYSNFWRYFHINFSRLGLKKLISTHYDHEHATYKMVYTGGDDENINSGTITPLEGNGDFRSSECIELLKEADIAVTNPPFSLFRQYIAQLVEFEKGIIIIGNMNAITCKEIFPLFKNNRLWYGESIHSGDRKFGVPDNYPLEAAGCGIDENGLRYIKVKGVRWFTNLDYNERHKSLVCTESYSADKYPVYDNFSAININKTSEIPKDYAGLMGVPISFMDKYCPEQFEIIGISGNLASPIVLPNGKRGSGRFYLAGKRLYDRIVIRYTEEWKKNHPIDFDVANKRLHINNRRYTGSKYKLMPWIKQLILAECSEHKSLFDVFGGTGVVTAELLDIVNQVTINDFLYSNEIIYRAFFGHEKYDFFKLQKYETKYNLINCEELNNNYVSENYGGKYFRMSDARLIGFIRQDIENEFHNNSLTCRERDILLASLLYSFDRCANTVGHYEAYIKGKEIRSKFLFSLIEPLDTIVPVDIYREDSNLLATRIQADIAFIDPPYNSRQYSRFYHVMETITKWDKPQLLGTAMKPPAENMSDYCRSNAPVVFADLISKLRVRYIVVTYNNTYDSKSSSSQNKITLAQIKEILSVRGETKIFSKSHHRFNAGKTDKSDHKEYVFITKTVDCNTSKKE